MVQNAGKPLDLKGTWERSSEFCRLCRHEWKWRQGAIAAIYSTPIAELWACHPIALPAIAITLGARHEWCWILPFSAFGARYEGMQLVPGTFLLFSWYAVSGMQLMPGTFSLFCEKMIVTDLPQMAVPVIGFVVRKKHEALGQPFNVLPVLQKESLAAGFLAHRL